LMPSIETPDPVHAVKSHHEARFDLIVPPPPPHLLQAPRCTVVTSSRRLPKKVKARLQNSDAEHRVITNCTMKRLRSGREEGTRMRISFEQFGECRCFLLDEKLGNTQV